MIHSTINHHITLKTNILAIASIIAAGTVLYSCGEKKQTAVITPEDEATIVELSVAEEKEVPGIETFTGTVEASNINNIAPSMANRIKAILVDVGDHVRRGQTVVTLDNASSEQLKINLDQIKRELDRAQQLLDIGAGTRQAVDQLQAQYDAAKRQYANTLENTVLTSPVTGVVTERNYDPGDMTGQKPVLTVGQVTPTVKVIISPSEANLASIKRGMKVDVMFDAYHDETFTGTVGRIHPTVDASTHTFNVEVDIPNNGEKIKPGMYARVEIDLGSRRSVVVSDKAVIKQPGSGNKYVYVYSNGTVSYNKVDLGRRIGEAYELLGGVENGDSVVIAGQTRLSHGAKATVKSK